MDPFPSVRNRQERAVECLTTGHCGAQPQLPKVRSLMGPCPGEGARARVGDITGWLVSSPPSPPTPLDCGTPSNTQSAHPKHIISTVALLSWSPSLPFVGKTECNLEICSTLLSASVINPPTLTPSVLPTSVCVSSQLLASELQYGPRSACSQTRVQQGVTRRSSLCGKHAHSLLSPLLSCMSPKVLCRRRPPILVVLS